MNFNELKAGAVRALHKTAFGIKKHSPEILLVTGIVGTVVSTVMACKATTKLHDVLENSKRDIDGIHEATERGYIPTEEGNVTYSKEDSAKDLTFVYAKTGVNLAKLYGPAVIVGGLAIAAILTSNNIMHQRNLAVAAAYAAVDKGFKEYRGRVVDRFGAEIDRELKYNIKAREVEETVTNEDGTQTVVKKTVEVASPDYISDYARFFDDGCRGWTKDAESNLMYVRSVQNWCNDLLEQRGYLFLNEVYDEFGIQRTRAGQTVGWIRGEGVYVDFGIYDTHREKARDFVNGLERVVLLEPNVQGDIMHAL